jgi:nicotinate (nicotinamide) nucleotide adenylyltransferase
MVDALRKIIERMESSSAPAIELVQRARLTGARLGVFASSFNPPTLAHLELMRLAREQFSLDETLALAGAANADKLSYECSLEDRLMMLLVATEGDERASVGLSSHAYFVDMVEALLRAYPPETDLHFIIGFDTFERALDIEDRYTARYYRKFNNRREAIKYLVERSRLIVANRDCNGREEIDRLIEREKDLLEGRVLILETAGDLGERSATEVRRRARAHQSIDELVPAAVSRYIGERGLYRKSE